MNTMTRRVIVNARDYDTPSYTPTVKREKIAPMHGSEFEGAGAVRWIVASAIVGVGLCAMFFGGAL